MKVVDIKLYIGVSVVGTIGVAYVYVFVGSMYDSIGYGNLEHN